MLVPLFSAFLLIAAAQQAAVPADASAPVPASSSAPAAPVEAVPVFPTLPEFFPLTEVGDQTQATAAQIRSVDSPAGTKRVSEVAAEQLPTLTLEISSRFQETSKLLALTPTLEVLQSQEITWKEFHRKLSDWGKETSKQVLELESHSTRLDQLLQTWLKTQTQARGESAQPEIVQRIDTTIADIRRARKAADKKIESLKLLQTQVAAQDMRTLDALQLITQAQEQAFNQLLQADSPKIWQIDALKQTSQVLKTDGQGTFAVQWTGMLAYLERQWSGLVVHAFLIIVFFTILNGMRHRIKTWIEADASIKSAGIIFEMPKSTAVVLSMFFSSWLYPQAPRMFWAIWGGITLIPMVFVLHRLVDRPLWHLLRALVIFYTYGLILSVTASMPLISRGLFILEMIGGILFCIWFLRRPKTTETTRKWLWAVAYLSVRIALLVLCATLLANLLGYVGLSKFLANALLKSAYMAVALNAIVSVAEAVFGGLLHVAPLNGLRMVRKFRPLFRRRIHLTLRWAAIFWWAVITLDLVSLRKPFVDQVVSILDAPWTIGAANLSLGGILAFAFAITASFYLSKFIRFLLDEDVYPRVHLARGVPYAISTVLHYVLLLVGFILAVAALGYDMTKFTILAGAFGVGLGFGMQNIVNNFVSGLILLFERPVQVGDIIQIDTVTGTVSRIGIRASILKVGDGSEIVVPNGKLISDRFTNWTLSDRKRRITLPLIVVRDSDPKNVMQIMTKVAKAHPMVAALPAPQTYFIEFVNSGTAGGGMKFELSLWTNSFEDGKLLQSDLAVALHTAITAEGIKLL